MVGSKDSETRYKLCRDMPMEKGPIFEEWLKEFLDAAGGEGDDDASWAQTLEGTDRRAGLSAAHALGQPSCRVVRWVPGVYAHVTSPHSLLGCNEGGSPLHYTLLLGGVWCFGL